MMRDIVIVEAVRTAIGRRNGALADVRAAFDRLDSGEQFGKVVVTVD